MKKLLAFLSFFVFVFISATASAEISKGTVLELDGFNLTVCQGEYYEVNNKVKNDLYVFVSPFYGEGNTMCNYSFLWTGGPFELHMDMLGNFVSGEEEFKQMLSAQGLSLSSFSMDEPYYSSISNVSCIAVNCRIQFSANGVSNKIYERQILVGSQGYIISIISDTEENLDIIEQHLNTALTFIDASTNTRTKVIHIPEKGISIATPVESLTFELSDPEVDERLEEYGYTRDILIDKMTKESTYLYVFDPFFCWDISFTIGDINQDISLENMGNDEINATVAELVRLLKSQGSVVDGYDVHNVKRKTFFRIWGQTPDSTACKLQYYTWVDSRIIVITLTRYDGSITENDKQMIDVIVEASDFIRHEVP